MRNILVLLGFALLIGGCNSGREADLNHKAIQKSVNVRQIDATLHKLDAPRMTKEALNQSDGQTIAWLRTVDHWTNQILSSPVTGEMDESAMRELRNHLMQVYSPELADNLIAQFYNHDPIAGTYQAISTDKMLNLQSVWQAYELRKTQPSPDQIQLELTGINRSDVTETRMHHVSTYRVQGDGTVIVTGFQTRTS